MSWFKTKCRFFRHKKSVTLSSTSRVRQVKSHKISTTNTIHNISNTSSNMSTQSYSQSDQHHKTTSDRPRFEWNLEQSYRAWEEQKSKQQSRQQTLQQRQKDSEQQLQNVVFDQLQQFQHAIVDQLQQVRQFYSLFGITFYRLSCI